MITAGQDRRRLVLIMVAAALVRGAFILWGYSGFHVVPRHGMSWVDFRAGYAIAAGYGYVTGLGPAREHLNDLQRRAEAGQMVVTPETAGPLPAEGVLPQMIHPPGLSVLVAALHRALRLPAEGPIEILGLLLDTVATVLLFLVAAATLGPRVGFVAGMLYALFPPLAYWSTVTKSADGLLGPFIVGALYCTWRATWEGGGRSVAWLVLAGASIGLGSYVRPDYLFLPVFFGAALAIAMRSPRRAAAAALSIQAVAIVVLLPWAWRNHRLSGRFIFTSTSVGATLLSGLSEFGNAWGLPPEDEDREREARAQGFATAWVPEADHYFRGVFWTCITERPLAYAATIVRRLPLALATPFTFGVDNPWRTGSFTAARRAGEDHYDVLRTRPIYLLMAYGDRLLMAVIGLAGTVAAGILLVAERRRAGPVLLLLSPHLYSIGTHLLTHLEPRYLLPSVFSWLVALAYVLVRGWNERVADGSASGSSV